MEKQRSLVQINKNLARVMLLYEIAFLFFVGSLLIKGERGIVLFAMLTIMIITPVLSSIAYKKHPNSRYIEIINGTGMFLAFALTILFVDSSIYPIIISYVAIYAMFASKKTVLYVVIPYALLSVVKLITVTDFSNFSYSGETRTAIMMLISMTITMLVLFIVSDMFDKQLLVSEKALADIEKSNKEQQVLTNTILEIVDSTTKGTDKINNIVSDINTSTKSVANAISELAGGLTIFLKTYKINQARLI